MKLLEVIEEKPKKKLIVESGLPDGFTRGEGIAQVADNRFLFILNNNGQNLAFSYDTRAAADAAMDEYTNPNTNRDTWIRDNNSRMRTSRWQGAVDAVDEAQLNARIQRSPNGSYLQRLASNPLFRPFTALIRIAGPIAGIYFGIIDAAADVDEEFRSGEITREQRDEEIGVLYGMFVVEVGAVILFCLRTARLARRFITALRAVTRVITVGLAAAGAPATLGTSLLAGAVVFLIQEAAWFVVARWITSATVQNALKDAMINVGAGFIFEGIGTVAQGAAAALEAATDGVFGSRDLRRWLGFPSEPREEEFRAAAYGSSEWAKLVMGAIMHPPDAPPILVPYYPEERRQAMLAEKLNISESEVEQAQDASATGDPGAPDQEEQDPGAPDQEEVPYDDAPMRIARQQASTSASTTPPTDTRSAAAQQADPDGDGNADDPEAQVFAGPR